MSDNLDLTHTLHKEDGDPMTLKDLYAQRIVATNDSRGVAYTFGNRALRRQVGRKYGAGGKPKQFHKQGH